MSHNRPLNLTVAETKDFVVPLGIFSLLLLFSVALSPRLILLISLIILFLVAGWCVYILEFSKVKNGKLTSVIFPDGQVRLQSRSKVRIRGVLVGQQWSTHRLAILRVNTHGVTRNLLILAAQQQKADDFRRLNMWLRQDFCSGTEGNNVPLMTRAIRVWNDGSR